LAKKLAFFAPSTHSFFFKFDRNIGVFEKKAHFFAENCQKSQQIVIMTLVPGTDVMIFKNIFAKKIGEKIGVFRSLYS
jgi:hypothetical protein